MNKKQRESVAKYLYDISKGIALVAVVGSLVKEKWDSLAIIFGCIAAFFTFICGFILEGSNTHERHGNLFFGSFNNCLDRGLCDLLHPETSKGSLTSASHVGLVKRSAPNENGGDGFANPSYLLI